MQIQNTLQSTSALNNMGVNQLTVELDYPFNRNHAQWFPFRLARNEQTEDEQTEDEQTACINVPFNSFLKDPFSHRILEIKVDRHRIENYEYTYINSKISSVGIMYSPFVGNLKRPSSYESLECSVQEFLIAFQPKAKEVITAATKMQIPHDRFLVTEFRIEPSSIRSSKTGKEKKGSCIRTYSTNSGLYILFDKTYDGKTNPIRDEFFSSFTLKA